jgi:hypothetical protein
MTDNSYGKIHSLLDRKVGRGKVEAEEGYEELHQDAALEVLE